MPFHDRNEPGRVPKPEPAVPGASGPPRPPTRPPKPPPQEWPTFIDTGPATGKKSRGRRSSEGSLTPGVALVYALVVAAVGVFLGGMGIVTMNWNAVKVWVKWRHRGPEANTSVTVRPEGGWPPSANDAPSPSDQSPSDSPGQAPTSADVAKVAADRAKQFADDVTAKKQAFEPHLANAAKLCEQLEGIAKGAGEAVAAGKSPQPIVERFAAARAQFTNAVEQAVAITKEARSAAHAAEAAAKEAADHAGRARQEFNTAKSNLDSCRKQEQPGSPTMLRLEDAYDAAAEVLKSAEGVGTTARTWAKKAHDDAGTFESSDRRLQDVRSRVTAAEELIKKSRGDVDTAQKAFNALKDQLDAAGHLPNEGLDTAVDGDQTNVLCNVGDARVALRLPSEPVTTGTGATWRLECVSGSAADTWNLYGSHLIPARDPSRCTD